MSKLYMGTTKKEATKTAGEIQSLLSHFGIERMQTTYAKGECIGLDFIINIDGSDIPFSLPVRWEPVLELLKRSKVARSLRTPEQARRVAWRQVFRWVQAQLALVETGQVKVEEIFMPYIMVNNSQTMFEQLTEKGFTRLEHIKQ